MRSNIEGNKLLPNLQEIWGLPLDSRGTLRRDKPLCGTTSFDCDKLALLPFQTKDPKATSKPVSKFLNKLDETSR